MKILVIPDTHCRKFWREAIANNIGKVDKVIFLGDYLDPYPDEIENNPELMECNDFYDSENALKMLNDIISLKRNEPDKYILLTGNHSDHYIWYNFSRASRSDKYNQKKYHDFFIENLKYFNLVWVEDNVIFSHAGILEEWAQRVAKELSKNDDYSVMDIAIMFKDITLSNFDNIDIINDISPYRGGYNLVGSSEWADLREHINIVDSTNDNIIPKGENGIYQVFGHTQLKAPLITDKWACLDCRRGFIIDTITYEITNC